MTEAYRLSYLTSKNIHPDTIPGRACLAGHWDNAPGMIQHVEQRKGER